MDCKICGRKDISPSMGGADICGACDCGGICEMGGHKYLDLSYINSYQHLLKSQQDEMIKKLFLKNGDIIIAHYDLQKSLSKIKLNIDFKVPIVFTDDINKIATQPKKFDIDKAIDEVLIRFDCLNKMRKGSITTLQGELSEALNHIIYSAGEGK